MSLEKKERALKRIKELDLVVLWYSAIKRSHHQSTLQNEFEKFNGSTLSRGGLMAALRYIEKVDDIHETEREWFKNAGIFSQKLKRSLKGLELDGSESSDYRSFDDAAVPLIMYLREAQHYCKILSCE